MGLFGLFKKKEKPTKEERQFDRLTIDGAPPFGWHYANKAFIDQITSEFYKFYNKWVESKNGPPLEQYAALKSLVVYMDDVRKLCKEKGECFVYWSETFFGDEDFQNRQKELQYIKDNFDDLVDKYQREQYIKQRIIPQAHEIIREHPGILQSEIFKMFPVDCKVYLSDEFYFNGDIIREKSGRSYSLRFKE